MLVGADHDAAQGVLRVLQDVAVRRQCQQSLSKAFTSLALSIIVACYKISAEYLCNSFLNIRTCVLYLLNDVFLFIVRVSTVQRGIPLLSKKTAVDI